MNKLLYKRDRQQKIDWAGLVFHASAHGDRFQELTVVTLKSHYKDICYEEALRHIAYAGDEQQWYDSIQRHAEWLMNQGDIFVREFVRVDEDRNATVAINAAAITDAEIDIALSYLADAEIPGTAFIGEFYTFTSEHIKEMDTHEATIE